MQAHADKRPRFDVSHTLEKTGMVGDFFFIEFQMNVYSLGHMINIKGNLFFSGWHHWLAMACKRHLSNCGISAEQLEKATQNWTE